MADVLFVVVMVEALAVATVNVNNKLITKKITLYSSVVQSVRSF
jgi:hypothetical protein